MTTRLPAAEATCDLLWAVERQAWKTGEDSLEYLVALAEYERALAAETGEPS